MPNYAQRSSVFHDTSPYCVETAKHIVDILSRLDSLIICVLGTKRRFETWRGPF